MFKNLFLYRVIKGPNPHVVQEMRLDDHSFIPCDPTQNKSSGWVPPRGEANGALLESIGGQHILKLLTETKAVPAATVKRKVEEMCAQIEATTGRKPGKKERREFTEDALLALLPQAFPKQYATLLWIDSANKLLVIDASSQSKADDAIAMMFKSFEGLQLSPLNTVTSPASAMAHTLLWQQAPDGFTIDHECELKATDESKAVVKYGRHALDIEEVAQHIRMGKMPTKLAMTYSDRVSFVLTEGMQLKKIELMDVAFADKPDDAADNFDADVTIYTGELSKLIPELIAMMGGEVDA